MGVRRGRREERGKRVGEHRVSEGVKDIRVYKENGPQRKWAIRTGSYDFF